MARLGAIAGGMAILVAMLLIAGCGKPQTSKSEQQPAPAPPPAVETPEAPVAEAPAPPPGVETPAPAPANPLRTPAPKPVAPTVAAAPSTAVFPSAILPTYANEKHMQIVTSDGLSRRDRDSLTAAHLEHAATDG